MAEQRTDLFAALLKAAADDRFGRTVEDEGRRATDEVEEVGLDVGARVKAGGMSFHRCRLR